MMLSRVVPFPCPRRFAQLTPVSDTGAAAPRALAGANPSCFAANYWNVIGTVLEFFIALFTNAFFYAQLLESESCQGSGPYFGYRLSFGVVGFLMGLWSTTSVLCHYLLNNHENDPRAIIIPRLMAWSQAHPWLINALIFFIMIGDYLGHIADVVSGFILWASIVARADLTICALEAPLFSLLVLAAIFTSVANVRTCLGHLVMEIGSTAWIKWMRGTELEGSRWHYLMSCLKSDGWTKLCLGTEASIAVPAYGSLYANVLMWLACLWSTAEPGSGPDGGYTLSQLIFGVALGLFGACYAYSQSLINSQSKDISEYTIQGIDDVNDDANASSSLSESPITLRLSGWQKVVLMGTVAGTTADLSAGVSNIMLYFFKEIPCWGQVLSSPLLLLVGLLATVATLWTCYQALLTDKKERLGLAESSPVAGASRYCCALRDVSSQAPRNVQSGAYLSLNAE